MLRRRALPFTSIASQVAPGCAGNSIPHRRLLRVVSAGANGSAPPDDVASAQNDADLLPTKPETQYTHILDTPPSASRVFAFTGYPHTFTVEKSKWIIGPPTSLNPGVIDYYLTMINSSDGQEGRLRLYRSIQTFSRPMS